MKMRKMKIMEMNQKDVSNVNFVNSESQQASIKMKILLLPIGETDHLKQYLTFKDRQNIYFNILFYILKYTQNLTKFIYFIFFID